MSLVFTYMERLKDLFFQKPTQNLFNKIKTALPISENLYVAFETGVSYGNADKIT